MRAGSRLAAAASLGCRKPPRPGQTSAERPWHSDGPGQEAEQETPDILPDRLAQQIYLSFLEICASSNKQLLQSKAKLSFKCVALHYVRMVDCRLVCRQPSILILA